MHRHLEAIRRLPPLSESLKRNSSTLRFLQLPFEQRTEFFERVRFGEKPRHACSHAALPLENGTTHPNDGDQGRRLSVPHPSGGLEPIRVWEPQVEQDEIEPPASEDFQRLFGCCRLPHIHRSSTVA